MLPKFFVCKPLHASLWHVLSSIVKNNNRRIADWHDKRSNTSVVSSHQGFQNLSPLTWYRRHVVNTNTFLVQCPGPIRYNQVNYTDSVHSLEHELHPWPTLSAIIERGCGEATQRTIDATRNEHAFALLSSELIFPCGASDLSPGKCVMVVLQPSMLIAR